MVNKQIGEVGVRFCSSCEHNIKCVECSIEAENENLLRNYEVLIEKHKQVCAEVDEWKLGFENERARTRELEEELSILRKEKDLNYYEQRI